MRYCGDGQRKFQRDIRHARSLYSKRDLRFVRNNEVLYWRFLAYLEDMGYRPRTTERYYAKLRTFLAWLGHRSLRRVKREEIEKFLLWFKQEHTRVPYMIRYMREVLAVFFGFLMLHAAFRLNPARGLRIRMHFPQHERMDLFSPEETLLLVRAPREYRERLDRTEFPTQNAFNRASYTLLAHYLILKLMFSSGIRPCEITQARREDLQQTALLLRVRNKGNQQYITAERNIFLTSRTVEQLNELLATSESRRGATSDERLFLDYRSGNPLDPRYPNKVVKQWALRCGIVRNVYAYMCRYTFCTRLVENGVDAYSLKRLMGHKQMATSLIHYLKLTPGELRREWRQYNPLAEAGTL